MGAAQWRGSSGVGAAQLGEQEGVGNTQWGGSWRGTAPGMGEAACCSPQRRLASALPSHQGLLPHLTLSLLSL